MIENYQIIKIHLNNFAALTEKDTECARQYWKTRKIKKGDFFNMKHVVCNDLGFVVKGIFGIYYNDPVSSDEKTFSLLLKTNSSFPFAASLHGIPAFTTSKR